MVAPNASPADRAPSDAVAGSPTAGPPAGVSVAWAAGALVLTAGIAVVAKTVGVLVAPGLRGVAPQRTVESFELVSATLAYTLAALLVALVCGGSFELARARRIGVAPRGVVVGLSGLVVALASPAVVERLHTLAALMLALVTSVVALVAALVTVRATHTRALGAVLGLLAICGLLRATGWEAAAIAGERANLSLYQAARALSTLAVVLHGVAALLAAAWLGTRSRWRGRVLANAAIILAFAVTYLAARSPSGPSSTLEAVLRGSLVDAAGLPLPYGLAPVAAFLLPASVFLAGAALAVGARPAAVVAALALALLSHGSFDVPLHALAIVASAQWAMLAMADDRAMWVSLTSSREQSPGR